MTQEIQNAKTLIHAYHVARDAAAPGAGLSDVCRAHLAPDHAYRGPCPFDEISGPAALADTVWSPLKSAMPLLQRRPDIFFAGHNHLDADGATWAVEMGNFLGDFTSPWLGIPPTGKLTYLPYAAMYLVRDRQIVETVEFLDILAVLTQAGRNPFAPSQTGGLILSPGPKTHDGILTPAQDADATRATYDLTHAMLTDLAKTYASSQEHLERFWHPDMNWHGPTGIGASVGISGYQRGHTGPFQDLQEVVEIHDWELALAEGNYSAFMWWPCLTLRNTGGYLGVPANVAAADMRVVDLYRRDGDKLAENWIFIDILHFMKMQGADLLAEIGDKA